jgi:predicted dehydrogenase
VLYDAATGQPHRAVVDDDVNVLLKLANGCEGTLALSRLGAVYSDFPIGHRQLLIDGSAAGIAYANGEARLYRPDHSYDKLPVAEVPAGLDHAAFLAHGSEPIMRTLLQAITTGKDAGPTLHDGLACQAVIHAAQQSSQARGWVSVES